MLVVTRELDFARDMSNKLMFPHKCAKESCSGSSQQVTCADQTECLLIEGQQTILGLWQIPRLTRNGPSEP
jgi:hypothetical protein